MYAPMLALMKLHLYPNGKAKQKVFSWFFRGMEYSEFVQLGEAFASRIEKFKNIPMIAELHRLAEEGDDVYVVSASIEEWVRPFCSTLDVKIIIK